MDALGAIGIIRAIAFKLSKNEENWIENAIKEYKTKLKKLPEIMKTEVGKEMAIKRMKIMDDFIENLKNEIYFSNGF